MGEPNTGNRLIIGSYGDDINGNLSGSVYIYEFNSATSEWELESKLVAFDGAEGGAFGVSAGINGNHAIVGAYLDDTEFGGQRIGSTYILSLDEGTWTNSTKLEHSDSLAGDGFGTSVAIDGVVAIVGAPETDLDGETSGSVYLFVEDSLTGEWEHQRKIEGTSTNARMGRYVVIRGNLMMSSASYEDVGELTERGSVYAYEVSIPTST